MELLSKIEKEMKVDFAFYGDLVNIISYKD